MEQSENKSIAHQLNLDLAKLEETDPVAFSKIVNFINSVLKEIKEGLDGHSDPDSRG